MRAAAHERRWSRSPTARRGDRHHAQPLRPCPLHAHLHADRRVPGPARRQPRRGHLVGTLGVVVGALGFYPRGEFFWGTVVITCFVFSDLIDGTMARMTERLQPLGRLPRLDPGPGRRRARSSAALALWFAGDGDDLLLRRPGAVLPGRSGAVVSYAKARAEGLGMTANVGIAERADRLVVVLVATGLDGPRRALRPGARAVVRRASAARSRSCQRALRRTSPGSSPRRPA